jgi:hypothetical protein
MGTHPELLHAFDEISALLLRTRLREVETVSATLALLEPVWMLRRRLPAALRGVVSALASQPGRGPLGWEGDKREKKVKERLTFVLC